MDKNMDIIDVNRYKDICINMNRNVDIIRDKNKATIDVIQG